MCERLMTCGDAVDRAYWSEEQQQNVMLNEKRNWALPPTRALSNSLREKVQVDGKYLEDSLMCTLRERSLLQPV